MKPPAAELHRRVTEAQIILLEYMLSELDGVNVEFRDAVSRQIADLRSDLKEPVAP